MKTVGLIVVLALTGCDPHGSVRELQREPAPAQVGAASPAEARAEDIPGSRVVGTLRGEPFVATSAGYRVELFPGRERVDLFLSEGTLPSQCTRPGLSESRIVWVRFHGVTRLPVGDTRAGAGAKGMELHYEFLDQGVWRGHVGGSGLVHIAQIGPANVEGRLDVCFRDGAKSCVRGEFHAKRCWTDLDLESAAGGLTGTRAQSDEAPSPNEEPR